MSSAERAQIVVDGLRPAPGSLHGGKQPSWAEVGRAANLADRAGYEAGIEVGVRTASAEWVAEQLGVKIVGPPLEVNHEFGAAPLPDPSPEQIAGVLDRRASMAFGEWRANGVFTQVSQAINAAVAANPDASPDAVWTVVGASVRELDPPLPAEAGVEDIALCMSWLAVAQWQVGQEIAQEV